MKKTLIFMGLAASMVFLSTNGAAIAADRNSHHENDLPSLAKSDRDDDKNDHGKGGRHDEDFCEMHPQACKHHPISAE